MQLRQQFLQLLVRKNSWKLVRSYKLPIELEMIMKQKLQNYSQELKNIYYHVFNSQKNELALRKVIQFEEKKSKMPACNKTFPQKSPSYYCFACCIHENACLCEECFQNGNHFGHRFKRNNQSFGGNCDCGDQSGMKKQGFCINHNGKFEQPIILQQQLNRFNSIMGAMFEWLFLLKTYNIKQYLEPFGVSFVSYISELNTESVHYNVMTYKLLTRKFDKQQCFLDQIFAFTEESLVIKFRELFFLMFSIEEFKEILADRLITAYNTILGFENTQFHSLYFQLLSNNQVVVNLSQKYKNTLFITKKVYNYQRYLNDLRTFQGVSTKAAATFYQLYLTKNKYIPFQPLNQIQEMFQQKGDMHSVDLVTTFINTQNLYYIVCENILNKIKNQEALLKMFTKAPFYAIMSNKYSYVKNKVIMPFHRIFAMALFTIFKGNLQQLSIKAISQKLSIPQNEVLNFYVTQLPKIMYCLFDFAQTYFRRNYFYNYNSLYCRSGVLCINYDYLYIKEAAYLMIESGKNFQGILDNLFKQSYKIVEKNKNKQMIEEFIHKWMYFYQILIEIAYSYLPQIAIMTKTNIQNKNLNQKKIQIFKSIIKKVGSVTYDDLQVIQKYFIKNATTDNFLYKNTIFNKVSKKYFFKPVQNQKIGQFHYEIYISKRKTNQMLLKEKPLDINSNVHQQPSKSEVLALLNAIVPQKAMQQFYQLISEIVLKRQNQKFRQTVYHRLIYIYQKIYLINGDKKQYLKKEQKIRKAFGIKERSEDINKIQQSNEQKDKLRKTIMMQKKLKLIEKQKKIILKLQQQNQISKIQETQSEISCIICKNQEKLGDSLFYLANVKFIQLLNFDQENNHLNNREDAKKRGSKKKYGFIYNSCFHTVHCSCLVNALHLANSYVCPFCRFHCNIILPVNFEHMSERIHQVFERIQMALQMILKKYPAQQKQWSNQKIDRLFKSMVSSIIEQIVFIGLFDQQQFKRKLWRICNILVKMLALTWNSIISDTKDHLYQQIGKMLETNYTKSQMVEQTAGRSAIKELKHFVISNIFTVIQGKPVTKIEMNESLKTKINRSNLRQVYQNLILVLENVYPSQSLEINKQHQQNKIMPIQQLVKFFKPPITVQQLIEKRDQIAKISCKAGHNVCICIDCQDIVCIQCSTLIKHASSHGLESIYFNLLTGGAIFITEKHMKRKSLYENNCGIHWTPNKKPEGYTLNETQYNKMTQCILCHSVTEYLYSKATEQNQNSFSLQENL